MTCLRAEHRRGRQSHQGEGEDQARPAKEVCEDMDFDPSVSERVFELYGLKV